MTETVTRAIKKAVPASEVTPLSAARTDVSREERRQMIAEAAYYRAEQRGFSSQDTPEHDWLLAEQEVDALLVGPGPGKKAKHAH